MAAVTPINQNAVYGLCRYGMAHYDTIDATPPIPWEETATLAPIVTIPWEALGFAIEPAPDVVVDLYLPRGPDSFYTSPVVGTAPSGAPVISGPSLHASPTRTNIKFTEGTTYRWGFRVRDKVDGAVNFGGATLTWAMYARNAPQQGASPILTKMIGNGIVLLDALHGFGEVVFAPADTTDAANIYDWELEIIEQNGDKWTPGMGVVIVVPSRRFGQ